MDYKALLEKYVAHVADCEGVTFIDRLNESCCEELFTTEETETLREIQGERDAQQRERMEKFRRDFDRKLRGEKP